MDDVLPVDDPLRATLHNEIHARPPARIRLPVLVTYVAVLNRDVSREQEWQHLCQLPGQASMPLEALDDSFLRLRLAGYTVKWERHTEFSRYSIVQTLPAGAGLGAQLPNLTTPLVTPLGWLKSVPGRTVVAIQLVMLDVDLVDEAALLPQVHHWFNRRTLVGARLGRSGAWVMTDLKLNPDGFERLLVLASPGSSETRLGRISMRLLEVETYRLMALYGLPVAKQLAPMLGESERTLADLTAQLEARSLTETALLDRLIGLAARIERATAEHSYRFSATRAYGDLVNQRITELHEQALPSTQTLGAFMRRRLSPALATVASTSQRLTSLSERVARTSALLRTRVDIATEEQNQQLLEKLTRGQALQLQLQSTVEGLSIAAISYYVVSLLLYGAKALKAAGLPIQPEVAAGALVPVVLWAVWRTTRRIHARLHRNA